MFPHLLRGQSQHGGQVRDEAEQTKNTEKYTLAPKLVFFPHLQDKIKGMDELDLCGNGISITKMRHNFVSFQSIYHHQTHNLASNFLLHIAK